MNTDAGGGAQRRQPTSTTNPTNITDAQGQFLESAQSDRQRRNAARSRRNERPPSTPSRQRAGSSSSHAQDHSEIDTTTHNTPSASTTSASPRDRTSADPATAPRRAQDKTRRIAPSPPKAPTVPHFQGTPTTTFGEDVAKACRRNPEFVALDLYWSRETWYAGHPAHGTRLDGQEVALLPRPPTDPHTGSVQQYLPRQSARIQTFRQALEGDFPEAESLDIWVTDEGWKIRGPHGPLIADD